MLGNASEHVHRRCVVQEFIASITSKRWTRMIPTLDVNECRIAAYNEIEASLQRCELGKTEKLILEKRAFSQKTAMFFHFIFSNMQYS